MKTLGTIIVFILLSGTTAYYAAKSLTLERQLMKRTESQSTTGGTSSPSESVPAPTASSSETSTSSPTTSPTASSVTVPDKIADKDRIVSFAQTHTVSDGETLSPIGVQYEINWQRIAEANRLKDPYPLSIGQLLVIPKVEVGKVVVGYSLNTDRATAAQSEVSAGRSHWRTDPVATSQLELGGAYGISTSDTFEEIARDDSAGSASVRVTHLEDGATQQYNVELTQPLTKGTDGVWAPTKLQPATN